MPPRADPAEHEPRPGAGKERHELGPDPELEAIDGLDPNGVEIDGLLGRAPTKHDVADRDVAAAACGEPIDDQPASACLSDETYLRLRRNLERHAGVGERLAHDGTSRGTQ